MDSTPLNMPAGAFGRLLRFWRRTHSISQETLALDAGISPRHLSFLETGKSLPSQEIVLRLAHLLKLNIRETNNLLASAGFAATSFTLRDDSIEHRWLHQSLVATLRGLDPFPSVIIDQIGNAQMMNRAWLRLLGQYSPLVRRPEGFNIVDLVFSDEGLKPYLLDWEDAICALVVTLQQDVLMFQDPSAAQLLRRIQEQPALPKDWRQRGAQQMNVTGFITTTEFPGQPRRQQMHVFHTVGATSFVSEPKLMIHTIYPREAEVEALWRRLSDDDDSTHPLIPY